MKLIAAGNPLIQDAVITGHDRDEVGALVFPSPAAKDLAPEAVLRDPQVVAAYLGSRRNVE